MQYARFELNGQVLHGMVEGEQIRELEGSVFDDPRPGQRVHALSEVRLLPPTRPTKIVCVAHNYRDLAAQIGEPVPEEPILFLKPPTCLIGHEASIVRPGNAERIIYEGELAVIIKHRMKKRAGKGSPVPCPGLFLFQ